ncbi:MAG TPA: ABC transporter substrate-binding protein [Isosphaeraceae bacterium]|nr:ABC transporter substrate-binding protein [Isosphaeraceae bacterium]
MISARIGRNRWLASGAVALLVMVVAWGVPQVGWGQVPTRQVELLKTQPFDRITLVDGTALDIEPVTPRPLPPFDPKKERSRQKKKSEQDKPPEEGNIGLPGEKTKAKAAEAKEKEEEETPPQITIHALEGDVRDFMVKRLDIKRMDYFEDMLLAEGEQLVRARQYPKAFEYFLAVQARNPRWRGLDDHVNKLLFEEGAAALRDSDSDRGLRLLGELHVRKPDYPGLADKLAAAYGERINKAFELGVYARGRQILHDLEKFIPNHDVVKQTKSRFIAKAQGLVDDAAKKSGGERLDNLIEALRIWPALESASAVFPQSFAEQPTLDVAVLDVPRPVAPWVHSPASARASRLVYLPVLAAESEAAIRGNLPGQLAASMDKGDLGKRLELRIRTGIPWSDGTRAVSAIDLVRALSDRTAPRSPAYNARWADLLERVEALDEDRIEVTLTRAFLKPEAWMLSPVGPAHAAWDGWVTTRQGRQPVGDGPYRWQSSTKDLVVYVTGPGEPPSIASAATGRAATGSSSSLVPRAGQVVLASPAPVDKDGDTKPVSALAVPKIKRIREVRYPGSAQALAAFVRGDVAMAEHVPPDRVAALANNPEFKVGRYEVPTLHRIAFDGRNTVLRNRSLRRGLSYAIDRKTLLEENLLKRAADEISTISDGPFAKGSYADAPGVKPLGYDPMLAKMLVAAAKKEMGNNPIKLTFEYPAIPEAQVVVPKIAEAFRKVDVEIELLERTESELEEALRAGRRFDLAYRATQCVEPVWEAGPLLCPGYDAPPSVDGLASIASPRTLELLLRLERATELPLANGLVLSIDRESRDELPVLPLWQLEDHYAWRTRLKGLADSAVHLYQGIETWEIEAWFAKDPW